MAKAIAVGEHTYLKVSHQGFSRVLSVGRLVPAHWEMVEVTVTTSDEAQVVLSIKPMTTRGDNGTPA